jgi:predicted dehydrogenase
LEQTSNSHEVLSPVRIGVLGAGHLGKIHITQLLAIKSCVLVGFYDASPAIASSVSAQFGITAFASIDELILSCDAIDIVTPTTTHHEIATKCVTYGKHIFIEKPITETAIEAQQLIKMVDEANIICQIGHVERFNPAFLAVKQVLHNPLFIEVHRLSQFNPRGTDVSVVLDLMIHDLDIILSIVKSDIKRISASGVKVISDSVDIANARLEFNNGCVANITTSRISLKNMRKMRIFQKDAYLSIDFLQKQNEVVRITEGGMAEGPMDFELNNAEGKKRVIHVGAEPVELHNAIEMELRLFIDAIQTKSTPVVSAADGLAALGLAEEILRKINTLNDFQP